MKKVILSIVLFLSVFTYVNAQEMIEVQNVSEVEEIKDEEIHLNWQSSFKEAVHKAREEKKPILIYFTGSDWCGPCISLDKNLFHTEKFKSLSDEKMVLYLADYPRNTDLVSAENKATNEELSLRYAQTSFPTMIMINDKGEVLGRKNGIYMTEYYYPFFEEITSTYN